MNAVPVGQPIPTAIEAPSPRSFRDAVDQVFRADGPQVWAALVAATAFEPYDNDTEALLRLLRTAELRDNAVLQLLARSERVRLAAYQYRRRFQRSTDPVGEQQRAGARR